MTGVRPVLATSVSSDSASDDLGDDLDAGVGEHLHDARAREHDVLGHDHAHGSSARTNAPAPGVGGPPSRSHRPPTRDRRREPGPRGRARRPQMPRPPVDRSTVDSATRRYLATPPSGLGRSLGDELVGGRLDGCRAPWADPLAHRPRVARGDSSASARECDDQPGLGQDRGMDAVGQLPQLLHRGRDVLLTLRSRRATRSGSPSDTAAPRATRRS